MFGAKLSWCQIVRCQIVLVPNCPGAKLSVFIILVPNCPLLLSWCQIVRFIILVPNCQVPNCPVPNCPVPNCPVPNCPVPNCPTIHDFPGIWLFKIYPITYPVCSGAWFHWNMTFSSLVFSLLRKFDTVPFPGVVLFGLCKVKLLKQNVFFGNRVHNFPGTWLFQAWSSHSYLKRQHFQVLCYFVEKEANS